MPRYKYRGLSLIVGTIMLVVLAGAIVNLLPPQQRSTQTSPGDGTRAPQSAASTTGVARIDLEHLFPSRIDPAAKDTPGERHVAKSAGEIQRMFDEASTALSREDFTLAVKRLIKIEEIQPSLPAVSVNLGFAYVGLAQYTDAEHEFQRALRLAPGEPAAYYGLSLVHESRHELDQAVAAMKTFLHLAPQEHQFRRKAESAVWEWEAGIHDSDSSQ